MWWIGELSLVVSFYFMLIFQQKFTNLLYFLTNLLYKCQLLCMNILGRASPRNTLIGGLEQSGNNGTNIRYNWGRLEIWISVMYNVLFDLINLDFLVTTAQRILFLFFLNTFDKSDLSFETNLFLQPNRHIIKTFWAARMQIVAGGAGWGQGCYNFLFLGGEVSLCTRKKLHCSLWRGQG